MKKLITICLVCVLTTAAWGTLNITFDENGNGNVDGTKLVWDMGIPPQAGEYDQYATLYYVLPAPIVEGDWVLYEYAPDEYISDVLRFVNIPTENESRVYVYSNPSQEEEQPELADTGIPGNYLPLSAGTDEQGNESGWSGFVFTPSDTLPGYMSGANVTYNFTSDVPEPVTICLLGLGALSLIRRKRRT